MIPGHPVAQRVVEVSCRQPADGGYGYASGYHIGGGLVLTTRHVLSEAGLVEVRFGQTGDYSGAEIVWQGRAPSTDLTLLQTVDPGEASQPPGLGYLEPVPARQVDACLVGFPAFKNATGADGRTRRDTEQVDGQVATTTNARSGLLEIVRHGRVLTAGPAWKGISGSAVFAHGVLIGVVSAAESQDSPLHAVPLASLFPESGRLSEEPEASVAEFWTVVAGRADRVGPAHRRSFYRDRIEQLASHPLHGRDAELAAVEEFLRSDKHYGWIVGQPWAGKTALASALAASPPAGVDVVAFFVSRGQNEQTGQFRQAVCDQLAALLDIAPQSWSTQADVESLWSRACHRAELTGRRLLLLVDGLDENDELPPIAALLPDRTGSHAYVLLLSRLQPPLPAEVSLDHPLRDEARSSKLELTPSPHAGRLRERAIADLRLLLRDHDARAMLALLAVAGPLTVADISALLGTEDGRFDLVHVRTITDSAPGRILTMVSTDRFAFAHDELRQGVRDQVGPDVLARHANAVHRWADRYAELDWPDETPSYLLDHYPTMLTAGGDVERFVALPSAARMALWRRRMGHDSLAVEEISTALDLLGAAGRTDLPKLAALAMRRFRVIERISSETYPMPATIPAAWARAGEWNRATFLANHISRGGQAFADMAASAARDGDHDRYADLADRARVGIRRHVFPDIVIRDLTRLAAVARRAGDDERCRALLAESERSALDLWQRRGSGPRGADATRKMDAPVMADAAEAAAEAGRPDLAQRFLQLAAASAEQENARDYYLSRIARSWAKHRAGDQFPTVEDPVYAADTAAGLAIGRWEAGLLGRTEVLGELLAAHNGVTERALTLPNRTIEYDPYVELRVRTGVEVLLRIAGYTREIGDPKTCVRLLLDANRISSQHVHPAAIDDIHSKIAALHEALGDIMYADYFVQITELEKRTAVQISCLRAAHERGDTGRVTHLARQAIADAQAGGEHLTSQQDPRQDLVTVLAECDLPAEAENLWHFLLPPRGYSFQRPDLVPVLVEVGDLERARQLATTAESIAVLAEGFGQHGLFNEVERQIISLPQPDEAATPHVVERAAAGAAQGGFFDNATALLRIAGQLRTIPASRALSVPATAAPAEIAAIGAKAGRTDVARRFAQLARQCVEADLAAVSEKRERTVASYLQDLGVTVPASGMFTGTDPDQVYGALALAEAASGSPYRPTLDRIASPAERAKALVRISELATNTQELLREACHAVVTWSTATDHAKETALTDIAVAAAARAANLAESMLAVLPTRSRAQVQAALAASAAVAGDHTEAHRRLDLAVAQDCPVDQLVRTALAFAPEKAADLLGQALVTSRHTPALLPLLVLLDPASAHVALELTSQ